MTESLNDEQLRIAAEREAQTKAEYGRYVATQPIMFNGARAYNAGDAVPVSNVEQYKYVESGLVREVTADAAPPAGQAAPASQPPAAVSTEKKD